MDKSRQPNSSTLFLVRLWVDEAAEEDVALQGRVVHVLSGQAHDFHDWQTLTRLLLEMMPGAEAASGRWAHES